MNLLQQTRERFGVSALLVYLLVGSAIMPADIFTASMATIIFLWIVYTRGKIPAGSLKLVWPMVLFLIVGSLNAFVNPAYDVFKDVWYVGKSIMAVMLGYLLMRRIRDMALFVWLVLLAAVLISLVQLYELFSEPAVLDRSLREIRQETGIGYILSALGAGIVFELRRYKFISLPGGLVTWMLIFGVCIAATALSFSRTQWVTLFLVVLVLRGLRGRSWFIPIMVGTLAIALVLGLESEIPESEKTGINATLLGKTVYSINEIVVSDYSREDDIHKNWRGYETYRALQTYTNGSYWEYVVGRGLGTSVDLGLYMKLGGVKQRYAPVLHNGFMYALVKTGIVGLALYLWWFTRLYVPAGTISPQITSDWVFARRLHTGLVFLLLVTSFVFGGFFSKNYLLPLVVLVGCFYGYLTAEPAPDTGDVASRSLSTKRHRMPL